MKSARAVALIVAAIAAVVTGSAVNPSHVTSTFSNDPCIELFMDSLQVECWPVRVRTGRIVVEQCRRDLSQAEGLFIFRIVPDAAKQDVFQVRIAGALGVSCRCLWNAASLGLFDVHRTLRSFWIEGMPMYSFLLTWEMGVC